MSPHLRCVVLAVVVSSACAPNVLVPEVKTGADEGTLARGKHLATVMGCNACHSHRDWTHFSGPLVEGTEFAGDPDTSRDDSFPAPFSFGAPNLTPHNLKDWSDGEIARATFLGQGRKGEGLFPLMPYQEWRDHIALDDVSAVISFLRSLPTKPGEVPERTFPIPGFVMAGFPKPRTLRALAPSVADADYGEYLTWRSGCMGCHTEADARGKLIGVPFAGGRAFALPSPAGGVVRSANLTPDTATGMGAWTKEAFIARFRTTTLESARAVTVGKGDFQTMMPWWAYAELGDEELGGIYDFLQALPATSKAVLKHAPNETLPVP